MSEIITIPDPGWDWFQFWVFMSVPVGIALVGLLCLGVSRFQSKRSWAKGWVTAAEVSGVASIISVAVCLIAAGITGTVTYSDHQNRAILRALNENGYSATKIVETDSQFALFINTDASMGSIVLLEGDSWQVTQVAK